MPPRFVLSMNDWLNEFTNLFANTAATGAVLSDYTSYRIGGPAQMLAEPQSTEQLRGILAFAHLRKIPITLIGAGSNVLISDRGIAGITCVLCGAAKRKVSWRPETAPDAETGAGLYGVTVSGNRIRAGAGALLDAVVRAAIAHGLGGMEKLSGIPGSVGGAVIMNAGAYGAETFDYLSSATALTSDGKEEKTFLKSALPHGYRHVEGLAGHAITSCEWELVPADAAALGKIRADTLANRAAKQPLELPSAGSVFKRPQGGFASKLIDEAGLKGLRIGGAEVSAKHAGFIINTGGASASDVYALIRAVQNAVFKKSGVKLETEQLLLGDFSGGHPADGGKHA